MEAALLYDSLDLFWIPCQSTFRLISSCFSFLELSLTFFVSSFRCGRSDPSSDPSSSPRFVSSPSPLLDATSEIRAHLSVPFFRATTEPSPSTKASFTDSIPCLFSSLSSFIFLVSPASSITPKFNNKANRSDDRHLSLSFPD